MGGEKIRFQFSVSIHLYKSLAQPLITMTFIYLDYEMKIMVPMCLTKLLESSNSVTVKMISELKKSVQRFSLYYQCY